MPNARARRAMIRYIQDNELAACERKSTFRAGLVGHWPLSVGALNLGEALHRRRLQEYS